MIADPDKLTCRRTDRLSGEATKVAKQTQTYTAEHLQTITLFWLRCTLCPFIEKQWALMSYLCLNIAMQWAILSRVSCCSCDMLSRVMCKLAACQPTDFCSSMRSTWGIERGTERERGVAGLRDRPFILKGLITMVISAWGTGYNARYQGIKIRFVRQAYFS